MPSETERAEEFRRFIEACPPEREIDLLGVNVSTAFHQARAKGWTVEELSADAVAAYRRGQPTTTIIKRLQNMADSKPTGREHSVTPIFPPRFVADEQNRIPPEWARERVALLMRCRTMTPDEAEQAMRDMIAEQNSRNVVHIGDVIKDLEW